MPARKFSVDPNEYPFTSRWLERSGSRMHYIDEGTGTPVLLLHGNPTWSYLYRNIIKELRGEARLIVPDYPGFGFSDHPPGYGYTPAEHADWVNALIDHLKLKNIVLVVQDWGGPIGFSIATKRPKDFAGFVILNTWCWPPTFDAKIFSWIMGSRFLGRYIAIRKNFFVNKIVPGLIFHKEKITPALLKAYSDPFPTEASRQGVWVFPREIRYSSDWLAEIESKLHLLKDRPVAMIWAKKDAGLGKRKYINRWLSHFPHAKPDELEDASHYIQEDRPDRIVEAIRDVLRCPGGFLKSGPSGACPY
ncbi:MAG: alpha/beta fold hydrolase [Nitrospirae bacterium]|nr:alpha/beta fold hydrolase [Nitrospirota bacterium]